MGVAALPKPEAASDAVNCDRHRLARPAPRYVRCVPSIGRTESAAVVRTDFSDEAAWQMVREKMLAESPEGWTAYLSIIDDHVFDALTAEQLLEAVTDQYRYGFLLVVDDVAIAGDAHAVLVVDLLDAPGQSFRAVPSEVQSIENNLSIANMDFGEFADSVDADGIFRGFPDPA